MIVIFNIVILINIFIWGIFTRFVSWLVDPTSVIFLSGKVLLEAQIDGS